MDSKNKISQRRARRKKIKIVFSLGVLVVVAFSVAFAVFIKLNDQDRKAKNTIGPIESPPISVDKDNGDKAEDKNKEENEEVTITISAVGDCTLGEGVGFGTKGTFSDELKRRGNDYSYFLEGVKEIFDKDDITIANLEGPLTNAENKLEKQFVFKGKPEYTKILQNGDVEVVNIANNHINDYLEEGLKDTVANLKKAGIGYAGMEYKHIQEVKGIKVGFLGYKVWENTKYLRNQVKKDITELKTKTNLVIVSFHWGEEMKKYPNDIQKQFGRLAVDSGADLVLGHHPHVIQGIEDYKGKNIVYSLGNFSFGGNKNPGDKDTFIFQQSFKFSKDGKLEALLDKNIIPCSVSSVSNRNDYRPTILTGDEKKRVLKRIEDAGKGLR